MYIWQDWGLPREHKILDEHSFSYLLSLTIRSKDILLRLDLYKRYSSVKLISILRNTVQSSLLFLHSQTKTIEWDTLQLGQLQSAPWTIINLRHLCATFAASVGSNLSTTFSEQLSDVAFHTALGFGRESC